MSRELSVLRTTMETVAGVYLDTDDLDKAFMGPEGFGLDPMSVVEVVTTMEQTFEFEIPSRDLWNLKTPGQLLDYTLEYGRESA